MTVIYSFKVREPRHGAMENQVATWLQGSLRPGLSLLEAQMAKNLLAVQEVQVSSLGWEDPLEKGIATQSSILAWEIPWTEEPVSYSPRGRKESDTTERLTLSL